METEYDIVYTIVDYWDGPRSGVAQFQGRPHLYQSVFDELADDWTDVFLLQPVDNETFQLELEDWEIWKRWRDAYDKGVTSIEAHPALGVDRERHDELKITLSERLGSISTKIVRARGDFTASDTQGITYVRWTPLDVSNEG